MRIISLLFILAWCFVPVIVDAQTDELNHMVADLAWSPDGLLLAAATSRTLRVYDTTDWDAPPVVLDIGEYVTRSITFSPDGQLLAVGKADGAQLWDVTTWEQTAQLPNNDAPVLFTPDGERLVTGYHGLQIWNLQNTQWLDSFGDYYWAVVIALSPDGKLAAIGNAGEGAHLWDVEAGEILLPLNAAPDKFDFSPDGTLLAWAQSKQLVLWDVMLQEGRWVVEVDGSTNTDIVLGIDFSPNSEIVAAQEWSGLLLLVDTTSGDVLDTQETHLPTPTNAIFGYPVAFSPDGMLLATGGADGVVKIWSVSAEAAISGPLATLDDDPP